MTDLDLIHMPIHRCHEIPMTALTKTRLRLTFQGYARVFNMDQETALPRPDEDLRLEAALAVKGNGAVP